MKYILLIYETPQNLESRKDPGHDPYVAAWRAYHKALVAAGAYVGGAPLKDVATATTVRLRDGRRHVQDGPFAEAKEQLGGFSSSTSLPSTRRSSGRRVARRRRPAQSSAADGRRLHATFDDPDARGGRACADGRGRGAGVVRAPARLPLLRDARRGGGRGRAERCAARGAHLLAEGRRAAAAGVVAAHGGAASADRPGAAPARARRARGHLRLLADESTATAVTGDTFPDRRAELLFVCAHPAIDPALHTPLMLQTVLGRRRRSHRAGVPRPAGDDGAAARAGQAEDPRGRHPLRASAGEGSAAASRRGARGDLRRIRPRPRRGRRHRSLARRTWPTRRSGSRA